VDEKEKGEKATLREANSREPPVRADFGSREKARTVEFTGLRRDGKKRLETVEREVVRKSVSSPRKGVLQERRQ